MKKLKIYKDGTYFMSDTKSVTMTSISIGDDEGVEVDATPENIQIARDGDGLSLLTDTKEKKTKVKKNKDR